MKIPLSWLKEYIDINLTPAQIAKTLTTLGLEVDAVHPITGGYNKVVVAKILEVAKHPDADSLCIAKVTDGEGEYQVVCGASNCRPGMKSAFAQVGATLVDKDGKTFKIKKTKLRGVESEGMLCSPDELNLANNHDGIIEFESHLVEGTDVATLYADTVFEVSLTPNLNHCASLIGVARELSASTGIPLRFPETSVNQSEQSFIASDLTVNVLNTTGCPRYACRLIRNVKVEASPEWMQNRLTLCGIRPVNNVVDCTNYVLLEQGHPLHAFDFDTLQGHQIIVKDAREGEKFVTLDGKPRTLTKNDLMICDQNRPIALAGIMGGENSEVSENTRHVLLEAAYFNPSTIRKTSKRLGLSTDASKRFERGTDPNCLDEVLDRAAMLIHQTSQGVVSGGILDVATQAFPPKHIPCRLSRINHVLGTQLSISEVENIFHRLQLPFSWNGQDTFTIKAPTYRVDLKEEIDLIEEVARLYGYDNIIKEAPRYHAPLLPHAPIFTFERIARRLLIQEGLQELLTCDLIGPALLNVVQGNDHNPEDPIKVLNPTSIEQSTLRTSLLPNLLQVVKYNWDHQNSDINGFEVGRIHFKEKDQYKEQTVAGIVLSGKNRPWHWDSKPSAYDFYDLKGIIENFLNGLNIQGVIFKENSLDCFQPGRQAAIYVDSLEIGSLGEVHPAIVRRLDVPQRIFFAEINLHDLIQVRKPEDKMKPLPIYPGSERDLTLTLPELTPIGEILAKARAIPSRLLESISLKDIYRSEKLGKGLKNATFRFFYRDSNKTLSQEAVDAEHTRLVEEINKQQK